MGNQNTRLTESLPSLLAEGADWKPKDPGSLCRRWVNPRTKD